MEAPFLDHGSKIDAGSGGLGSFQTAICQDCDMKVTRSRQIRDDPGRLRPKA